MIRKTICKLHNNILLLLVFLSVPVMAQVNTEKYRTPEEVQGLSYHLEVTGTYKTGNAEEIEADIDGRIDWKADRNTTFFVFQNEYEWTNGARITNERLFHIRNVWILNAFLRSEFFGQVNFDKKILIDNRELIGGGLRFNILDRKNSRISLGTSYMFEHEKIGLKGDSSHPEDVKVSRWSNYVSAYREIRTGIQVSSVVYYQPMFEAFSDYRIMNETALTVELAKVLSFAVTFKVRYDSDPPHGIKNSDTETDFGLAFHF